MIIRDNHANERSNKNSSISISNSIDTSRKTWGQRFREVDTKNLHIGIAKGTSHKREKATRKTVREHERQRDGGG